MMQGLSLIFLGLSLYGLVAGAYGAGLFALGMGLLCRIADHVFAAQDAAYNAHPRSAKPAEPSTNDALAEHDTESARTKF